MFSTAVLGCVWGDEGKAKIVDVLAENSDIIIRFQGGNNAGHTIQLNGQKYIFHLVPSGIIHPQKICVLASGVAIDPFELIKEINDLKAKGISFQGRFFIDPKASIVLPLHKDQDIKNESKSSHTKIGTTKRGIGPCYSDLIARVGIMFSDLFDEDYLRNRLENIYAYHDIKIKDVDSSLEKLLEAGETLKQYEKQIPYLINKANNKKILFEGAQGSLLDIIYGSYPFVTSSHTISGGIPIGCGFDPRKINKIIGVYKSYFTRVGEGPFPTELKDDTGDQIRQKGNEYGSTTGRPRRCGWFDAVAAKYTAMINGIDEIALTLLDVLSGFESIKICTKYQISDKILGEFPNNINQLSIVKPVYIELPGWKEDISQITDYRHLPENAKKYITRIEVLLKVKISIISVGPERKQVIFN